MKLDNNAEKNMFHIKKAMVPLIMGEFRKKGSIHVFVNKLKIISRRYNALLSVYCIWCRDNKRI